MGMFDTLKSKLRDANEALATAQKSWRAEQLDAKAGTLNERETGLAARERAVGERERDVQRRETRIGLRRLKYGVVSVLLAIGAFVVGIQVGKLPADNAVNPSTLKPAAVEKAPARSQPEAVPVPSDPRAIITLLTWREMPNGNREALTLRRGPSGDTYSRREIDCSARTFRYLGTGDTLEEAQLDRPDPGMAALTDQSISTYVSDFVCAK